MVHPMTVIDGVNYNMVHSRNYHAYCKDCFEIIFTGFDQRMV